MFLNSFRRRAGLLSCRLSPLVIRTLPLRASCYWDSVNAVATWLNSESRIAIQLLTDPSSRNRIRGPLENGANLTDILTMVSETSPRLKMPIVAMVSYAIILRCEPENFVRRALQAGIAGAIVPDLPHDESTDFQRLCADNDFSLVQLITPKTPDERALEIAENSSGFIYYVSIAGITGERDRLPVELSQRLKWLKQNCDKPVCVGFGISQPGHVEQLKEIADGVIIGSAIVKRMTAAANPECRAGVIDDIRDFSRRMVQATEV